ncbi:MAG: hypothetical protein CM15mP120_00900 [Pseudomonadota bacterium]|nr:MAG: hypothetical protein CM15mP120_00900 [Pseudomonadota bacterium]
MVVMAPDTEVEMSCGGAAMVDAGESVTPSGEVHPDHAVGVVMGKRYIDEAETLEVLSLRRRGSFGGQRYAAVAEGYEKLPKTDWGNP